jgi:hypothetical protein
MERENIRFQETQRFRQWWMWLIVGLVAAIFWIEVAVGLLWLVAPGLVPGAPDRGELPLILLIWGVCWLLFGIGLPLVIRSVRLIVEVGEGTISIRYFPLSSRRIALGDVKTSEVRQFRPVRDYGGVGIKWAPGKGRAYIVEGNQGVWMELTSGERLLIGSQRPDELLGAIRDMR